MWIKYVDEREGFIEIKYSNELDKARVIDQVAIQKTCYTENGYEHQVHTQTKFVKIDYYFLIESVS
jgi:hypothetical protein